MGRGSHTCLAKPTVQIEMKAFSILYFNVLVQIEAKGLLHARQKRISF